MFTLFYSKPRQIHYLVTSFSLGHAIYAVGLYQVYSIITSTILKNVDLLPNICIVYEDKGLVKLSF